MVWWLTKVLVQPHLIKITTDYIWCGRVSKYNWIVGISGTEELFDFVVNVYIGSLFVKVASILSVAIEMSCLKFADKAFAFNCVIEKYSEGMNIFI